MIAKNRPIRGYSEKVSGLSNALAPGMWLQPQTDPSAITGQTFAEVPLTFLSFTMGAFTPGMIDIHTPFQIDANFGYTAGVAEMLVQSHTGEIELLPALPKAWPTGKVTNYRIAAKEAQPVKVRVNGEVMTVKSEVSQ